MATLRERYEAALDMYGEPVYMREKELAAILRDALDQLEPIEVPS